MARYPALPLAMIGGYVGSSALFSVATLMVGQAFDLLNGAGATAAALLTAALLVLAVRAAQGVVSLAATLAADTLGTLVERDVRDELYLSLLGKSQTFHSRQRTGEVMTRATNDVQQLNYMINPGIRLIAESFLNALLPVIAIGFIARDLLLVPVVFLVVFAFTLRYYTRQLDPVIGTMRWQFGRLNSRLAEVISGIEVVKAYAQEQTERARFAQATDAYHDQAIKAGRVQARYLPLAVYGIAFGLAFGHALLQYQQGAISVGQAVAFMGLMAQLRYITLISGFSFSMVQYGLVSARRVLELITSDTELDENAAGISRPIAGAVTFDAVSFGYGDAPVLRDISFTARPGETIAIVGQTGAGKSSLTRLINRIYDTTTGRVLIDGHDVRDWQLDTLRSQIATIEQDVFLFSRTIAENIAFGAAGQATRHQIEAAAQIAQAHSFITSFPDGYDTIVGERGVTLSGGQRQRIALARAILTNPRILIIDDSTSAVDSATEDQNLQAMRGVQRDRTTFLITHRLAQIRWADRIILLEQGTIAAQGTHEELLHQSDAYRRLFLRQPVGDGVPLVLEHGARPLVVSLES